MGNDIPVNILVVIIIVFFIYFGLGSGSRLLKKKSFQYIVPPDTIKDKNWFPINFLDYKTYILISNYNSPENVSVLFNDKENLIYSN